MGEVGSLFSHEIDKKVKRYAILSRRLAQLQRDELSLIETWRSACESECEKNAFWEKLIALREEIKRTREEMDTVANSC